MGFQWDSSTANASMTKWNRNGWLMQSGFIPEVNYDVTLGHHMQIIFLQSRAPYGLAYRRPRLYETMWTSCNMRLNRQKIIDDQNSHAEGTDKY